MFKKTHENLFYEEGLNSSREAQKQSSYFLIAESRTKESFCMASKYGLYFS